MNKKYLIIVAVVLIGLGSYSLVKYPKAPTQGGSDVVAEVVSTTTPATIQLGMKIYRNEKFGFEFEYPQDAVIRENTFSSGNSKFNLDVSYVIDGKYYQILDLNLAVPKFADNVFRNYDVATSTVVVGGVAGIRYDYMFEGAPDTSILLPIGSDRIFLGMPEKENEDSFNKIISSFKFLGGSVASTNIDTSDWLTYKNDLYGYSLKYPKESIVESESVGAGIDFTNYFSRDNSAESQFSNSFIDDAGILSVDAGVVYREIPQNLSLQSWVKSVYNELNNINKTNIDGAGGEDIKYLNSEAYLLEYPITKGYSNVRGIQHEIYVIHSNHVYKFRYTTSSEFEAARPISEAIVNSIKFTK